MAEIRLLPLEEILNNDQRKKLERKLVDLGVEEIPESDESPDFEDALSEEQLTDFMDRLDAHDIACDIYLPVDFEGKVKIGEHHVGSAYMLVEALEEIRDELDIDGEDDEDDEDEILEMVEEQLHDAWRVFNKAATLCVERSVPLHVLS